MLQENNTSTLILLLPLLCLPLKLYNIIYMLALNSDSSKPHLLCHPYNYDLPNNLSLLFINYQIHAEFYPIFYSQTHLIFQFPYQEWEHLGTKLYLLFLR